MTKIVTNDGHAAEAISSSKWSSGIDRNLLERELENSSLFGHVSDEGNYRYRLWFPHILDTIREPLIPAEVLQDSTCKAHLFWLWMGMYAEEYHVQLAPYNDGLELFSIIIDVKTGVWLHSVAMQEHAGHLRGCSK